LLTADLLESGIIIDTSAFESSQQTGRPAVGIQLNQDGGYCIGVEIGVENVRVIVIDLMVQILCNTSQPLQSKEPSQVVNQVVRMIHEARATSIAKGSRIFGVGLTVPGMLNREKVVEYAQVLGWRNVDLLRELQGRLEISIYLENDANAAALAELYFGEIDGGENLFYLLLDVGVGSGIIIDKTIYAGSFGTAGEIGHMRLPAVVDKDAPLQTIPFEDCVGKRALLARYRRNGGTSDDLSAFCQELEKGAPAAKEAIAWWANLLAVGIQNIIDLLNPSHIILGGPLARFHSYLRRPLSLLQERDFFPGASAVQVTQSRFKEDACAMGAVALVYESLFRVVHEHDVEGAGYWIPKPFRQSN
jgi:predicted NBD/HSP70 family sugar kinase